MGWVWGGCYYDSCEQIERYGLASIFFFSVRIVIGCDFIDNIIESLSNIIDQKYVQEFLSYEFVEMFHIAYA